MTVSERSSNNTTTPAGQQHGGRQDLPTASETKSQNMEAFWLHAKTRESGVGHDTNSVQAVQKKEQLRQQHN